MAVVAGAGLFLALGSLGVGKAPAPPVAQKDYARVELRGNLGKDAVRDTPVMNVANLAYALDFSKHKDLQGDGWKKFKDKTVVVTGELRGQLGDSSKVVVEVTSIRLPDV
jgi:hypothetical protein